MKNILIILFTTSLLLFAQDIEENKKNNSQKIYKVVVLKEWKPYYITNNNQPTGYAIELFETIASNLNLQYEYIVADNWKELWNLVEDHKADIIPNVGIALKRAKYIDFTNTTDLFEISMFKNNTIQDLQNFQDIKNHSIGIVTKNVCTKLIDTTLSNNTITFNSFKESLDALKNKQIDTLCYPKPLVEYTLQQLNINTIKSFGEPLKVIKRAIGISKNNENLVEIFNNELFRLQASGTYHKIYDKWFGEHKDIELDFEQIIVIILVLVLIFLILIYLVITKHLLLTKKELHSKAEEMESLHQRFILAADEALAGYWEWNLDTNYLYLSTGWKSFLGYKEHELENSFETFKKLVHSEDFETTINKATSYIQKKSPHYKAKFRLQHKDGSFKWVNAIGAISPEDQNIFFGFHIDINDLTTTKETLITQSKSVMMGEMLALIAHQFKQPLSVISMLSSNQIASINLDEELTNSMIEKDAEETLKQILYLSETIDTFRDFLKPDKTKATTTIESVIKSSLNILNKSLQHNEIELIQNLSPTPELQLNHGELMQVFINIINNSKDAFKINKIENRIISIRTFEHLDDVVIEIEDSAGGINPQILEHIFDVYFTTKKKDSGTGIGLYIVKVILEEHYKGTINVENTTEGVKFTLTLPTK